MENTIFQQMEEHGMVSTSMQIPECGTSLSFFVSKKYYQKNNPIHER
jgi:hypothetical protein